VLKYLPLLLLGGCVVTHGPKSSDTELDESKRDWVEIYTKEVEAAVENEDEDAYHFFFRELLLEKVKIWKSKQPKDK
jgi:hypothetical protein